jgi:uncharacterized phage-associated protein
MSTTSEKADNPVRGASWCDLSEEERAKRIILEIARCSGIIEGKTRLYKIFYFAHLIFAKRSGGYLSEWPIVRMPFGPGIDDADTLLDELTSSGQLEAKDSPIGPYPGKKYRSLISSPADMPLEAISAIQEAVQFAEGYSASELSDLTHEHSRSWKNTENGKPLNVYVDLLSDESYRAMQQGADDMKALGLL